MEVRPCSNNCCGILSRSRAIETHPTWKSEPVTLLKPGSTRLTLLSKSRGLLWAARMLDGNAYLGLTIDQVNEVAHKRSSGQRGNENGMQGRFVSIVRPWLRYLGWWCQPAVTLAYPTQPDAFCRWM
jgi:hypothetical protein